MTLKLQSHCISPESCKVQVFFEAETKNEENFCTRDRKDSTKIVIDTPLSFFVLKQDILIGPLIMKKK